MQNDSGGTNPDTHAHEDKIWELTFEDNDTTNLTRMKMMELLNLEKRLEVNKKSQ